MLVIAWRFLRTLKNIVIFVQLQIRRAVFMHGILFLGEPFVFALSAFLHISSIPVECLCQDQGPSTYDVKGVLRKILGNNGYNTSQNFGICYQFSLGDICINILCLIHFNASKSQPRKYLCFNYYFIFSALMTGSSRTRVFYSLIKLGF
jgi:hypothetical protein